MPQEGAHIGLRAQGLGLGYDYISSILEFSKDCTHQGSRTLGSIWLVVKIMLPFWGTLNIRCRIILGIQKRDHNFDNDPNERQLSFMVGAN